MHSQHVAGPERSGLYYFRACTTSGRQFSFPWIVAPAQADGPVAVLASNITWNAYNNFGGRSNYIHADELPPTPTVNARPELKTLHRRRASAPRACRRLSRRSRSTGPSRSTTSTSTRTDHRPDRGPAGVPPRAGRMAAARLAGTRTASATTTTPRRSSHDGTLDLADYRVLIISTHPEYWTRQMYDRVKTWVFERGGRLCTSAATA